MEAICGQLSKQGEVGVSSRVIIPMINIREWLTSISGNMTPTELVESELWCFIPEWLIHRWSDKEDETFSDTGWILQHHCVVLEWRLQYCYKWCRPLYARLISFALLNSEILHHRQNKYQLSLRYNHTETIVIKTLGSPNKIRMLGN